LPKDRLATNKARIDLESSLLQSLGQASRQQTRRTSPRAARLAPGAGAAWSIWVGIAISTRANDMRVAQQLSALASLPTIAITTLISIDVIHATLALAVGLGAALLLANRLGWRLVSALFDRERLIANTR
jgi:hypothetical protein